MNAPGLRTLVIRLASLVTGLTFLGCAHTVVVEIPPKIDLQPYETIGIVEFASNSTENLGQIASREFMGSIQNAQPRVRFLELGPQHRLAREFGRGSLDIDAVKAIGKRYGVSSIFTGHVEISNVRPKVSVGADLSSLRASAVVNISMVSKHWETASGATIWSNARRGSWKVASIRSDANDIAFSMTSPEESCGRYVEELAFAITDPFRPRYERRKVSD